MMSNASLPFPAETLREIFQKKFPGRVIDEKFEASRVPEWDSIAHIELIGEIESHFQVTFEFEEIVEMDQYLKVLNFLKTKGAIA